MKILQLDVLSFEIPYKDSGVTTSLGSDSVMRNVLLAVHTDDGLVGWGETAPLPAFGGESQGSVVAVLHKYLAPKLLGRDARDINLLVQQMDDVIWGQPFAKSVVDFALHDLLSRYLEVPLYSIFGGKCRDDYPLAWTLGWKSVEDTVKEAKHAEESNYKAVKLKIGNPDWKTDVERVKRVREALGEGFPIRVDANQGYSVRESIRMIRRLEPFDLQLVEQPISRWDLDGMRYVRGSISTPVMADESASSPQDVMNIARHEAADIVNIKPQKIGGFVKTRQFIDVACAANIEVFPSSRMCSSIGVAAMSQFYAAIPNLGFEGEFVDGMLITEDDLVHKAVQVSNGHVVISDDIATGVEIDPEKIKKYSTGSVVISAKNRTIHAPWI